MLPLGGLQVKHAVQRGILVPDQHLSLQLSTCPAYNILARTAQKTPFLCHGEIGSFVC
jgi:hypothetical protein